MGNIELSSNSHYFSRDFSTARSRFRDAVKERGGRLDVLQLESKGPSGEELTIDIGWFGAPNPKRALVHSSGLHGVEGFAGSAIQLQWLASSLPVLPSEAAIAIVHVLNPYGCAWLRRVNENNVDLNRNFRAPSDDGADVGREYLAFDAFLNPQSVQHLDFYYARAVALVARYGMPNLKQAIAGGQCVRPKGIFYGGTRLEPGPELYQNYLAARLAQANWIVGIDVHTGLGRFGKDALLVDMADERGEENQSLRKFFGEHIKPLNRDSDLYVVRGGQQDMYYRQFPNSQIHFAFQEYGTIHALRVLAALRAENRWHHYGSGALNHPSKQDLLEAFCPRDEKWREKVLRRGIEVLEQAYKLAFESAPE